MFNCTSNFTTKTAYVLGFAAMTSTSVCRLCRVSTVATRNRLSKWEDPINDLNAFRKLAQSSLQAQVPRHDFSTIDNVPLQQYMA